MIQIRPIHKCDLCDKPAVSGCYVWLFDEGRDSPACEDCDVWGDGYLQKHISGVINSDSQADSPLGGW